MFIDHALNDNSANLGRTILKRGLQNISILLRTVFGSDDFTYVACPDFSISLRQRRLILGLPIGGYVNWSKYEIFPLELDVNSCGVHLLRLQGEFDEQAFRSRLKRLRERMGNGEVKVGEVKLKWNFSRRNHFINVYKDSDSVHYVVFHSSGETVLFDWGYLTTNFAVARLRVGGRDVPYIEGKDFRRYWEIAERENAFFFERHRRVFEELFGDKYELVFADQHFGMIAKGEILMGCSKLKVDSVFPILTRPFEDVFLARTLPPTKDISVVTGGYALVPHGLGMTVPNGVKDILPDSVMEDFVVVGFENGARMITDTLEHVGIGYRSPSVIPEMERRGSFKVEHTLNPVLCLKL